MTKEQEYAGALVDIIEALYRDNTALKAILATEAKRNSRLAGWRALRDSLLTDATARDFARRKVQSLRDGILQIAVDTQAMEILRQFQSDVIQ